MSLSINPEIMWKATCWVVLFFLVSNSYLRYKRSSLKLEFSQFYISDDLQFWDESYTSAFTNIINISASEMLNKNKISLALDRNERERERGGGLF